MPRRRKDPLVRRPEPSLTAHEIMAKADAVNMLNLVRDLTTYMPPPYKEVLLRDGHLLVKLGKYAVQVTINGRFKTPTVEYGRARWGL